LDSSFIDLMQSTFAG